MEPSTQPDGESRPSPEHPPPDAKKEPLVTGHSAHDDLLESARIGRPLRSYGHGIPLFPQAMIYIVLIAALAFVLFSLVTNW
jgi:hypothetical protein